MSRARSDREQLLADAFVGLADTLVDDDVIDVLDRLVGHSVTLLAADAAGIMLVDSRGRLRVVASSSEQSDWTELMQIQADDAGDCTWADFAEAIFEDAGVDCRVRRVATAELERPAPRPAYSVRRSERTGAPRLPHWRDGLRACLAELRR